MKKLFKLSLLFASLIIAVASCEIDNYPGPDAKFFGAIKDESGGGLVETDLINGSTLGMYEQGYPTPVLQTYLIKQNGEFLNNLVFSGTYNIKFESCNFFPFNVDGVVINPGDNERDFTVSPYIRIKNCSITYDQAGKKINASFNLEAGKPTVLLSKITLYAFTDIYVGEYVKMTLSAGTGKPSTSYSPAAVIDPATPYTLSIDLAANATLFSVHRNYYFRVGAMASQSGVGTIRTNYAPCVKIAL